jgi:hypothetical protein
MWQPIFDDNMIFGKTAHRSDKLGSPKQSKTQHRNSEGDTFELNRGVSLSRTMHVAVKFAEILRSTRGVVLELDQAKLAHNYKIIPFNYNSYYTIKGARQGNIESEEFVLGNIKNLDRYLVAIWSNNKDHPLKDHPKFKLLKSSPKHKGIENAGGHFNYEDEE